MISTVASVRIGNEFTSGNWILHFISVNMVCAMVASAMFQANVPEKVIQKTTGHRLIEAMSEFLQSSI